MKDKFAMGEEEETNTTTVVKKPTRHHVKRRSSGRVHVTKLAPMARANAHTDTEADEDSNERPVMRRSQSQRSLHRMSSDRKGFAGLTAATRRKSSSTTTIPTITDMLNDAKKEEEAEEQEETIVIKKTYSTHSTSNPASLTSRNIAQPIEQTLNATANTLVVPKAATRSKLSPAKRVPPPPPTEPVKKQPLKSQFLNNSMSRTQQKLMLQKQQAQIEDEASPLHPRNMQKVNKELEQLSREYKCIKRHVDPMKASLLRLSCNKASDSCYVPHIEQRQLAHRYHHLLQASTTRQAPPTEQEGLGFPWNATAAFLDRMFH